MFVAFTVIKITQQFYSNLVNQDKVAITSHKKDVLFCFLFFIFFLLLLSYIPNKLVVASYVVFILGCGLQADSEEVMVNPALTLKTSPRKECSFLFTFLG